MRRCWSKYLCLLSLATFLGISPLICDLDENHWGNLFFFIPSSNTVQHFSFVLTSLDSKWTFGFCRQAPGAQTALVIISYLPWHEFFYKILNQIAELMQEQAAGDMNSFLEGLYQRDVPAPSTTLHIPYGRAHRVYTCKCPNTYTLPSIPENVSGAARLIALIPIDFVLSFVHFPPTEELDGILQRCGRPQYDDHLCFDASRTSHRHGVFADLAPERLHPGG